MSWIPSKEVYAEVEPSVINLAKALGDDRVFCKMGSDILLNSGGGSIGVDMYGEWEYEYEWGDILMGGPLGLPYTCEVSEIIEAVGEVMGSYHMSELKWNELLEELEK